MKTLLIFILLTTFSINAQDLTISSGTTLTLTSGSQLYLNGLEFQVSSNFDLTGPNTISKSVTAINMQSINRVYNSNALTNYQGDILFHYKDTELNGITESDLIMMTKDVSSNWNPITSSLNTSLNILSYTFSTPTDIYGVTASDVIVLNIDDFDDTLLQVYPNPAISEVIINYDNSIEIEVYNQLGTLVLKTKDKSINISHLSSGIYVFKIKDIIKNKTTYRKVIKK